MADKNFSLAVQGVFVNMAEVLLKQWTCRHCGHQTSCITEFCDGCGIEDCNQGTGEELERDRKLRLAGKRRNAPALWPDEKVASMAAGLLGVKEDPHA